jgi:hypothetical protein
MFIRILKSNPILLLVFTVFIGVSVWLWFLFKGQVNFSRNSIFFDVFWNWISNSKIFSVILGLILLLVQAFVWNSFVNNNALLKQSSYFPAFFLILLSSCRISLISFYPALLASFFLVLSLRRIAASYKKESALSNVFDAGFFIGIATLFYPPLVVYILFLWIAILTMRSLIWREWVVAMIGFILPLGFTITSGYLFFNNGAVWYNKIISLGANYRKHWSFTWEEWLLLITVVGISIASTWLFVNKMADNVVKAQKVWALMVWFGLFAVISIVISPQRDACSMIILVLPASFIFSNYFLKVKSAIWSEVLFLCLLFTVGLSLFF